MENSGNANAADKRLAIVCSRWHELISEKLISGAIDAIISNGGDQKNIAVVRVPGSFEIPLACQELAQSEKFHAIVALGVLIEGDTDHYRLICDEVATGLSQTMLLHGIPVSFGVLTVHKAEDAIKRAGDKNSNKGFEAAIAALEMVDLLSKIRKFSA